MTPQEFVALHRSEHYSDVRAAMNDVDWSNVWPVVDAGGCLTGQIVESDNPDAADYDLCDVLDAHHGPNCIVRGEHCSDAQIMRKPTTTIKIYRRQDGNCIWAGSGKLVDGEIVDCAAALAPEGLTYSDGAEAEASERAYDAIEDAISQGESECESDGITYTWTLELD